MGASKAYDKRKMKCSRMDRFFPDIFKNHLSNIVQINFRHPPDPVDTSKCIPLLLAGWSHQRKRDSTQRVPKPEMLNQATSIINLFDINQVFFI